MEWNVSHKIQFMALIKMKRDGKSKFIGKQQRNRLSLSLYKQNEYRVTSTQLSYCFGSYGFSTPIREMWMHILSFCFPFFSQTSILLFYLPFRLFSFSHHFPWTATKTKASQTDMNSFFRICFCYLYAAFFVTVFILICFCFCYIFHRWRVVFFSLTPVVRLSEYVCMCVCEYMRKVYFFCRVVCFISMFCDCCIEWMCMNKHHRLYYICFMQKMKKIVA